MHDLRHRPATAYRAPISATEHITSRGSHRPHLYITWAEKGRSRSLYVPAEQVKRARRAHAAWAQFWETAVALGVQNREQFRQQCQKEKSTSRRPHGSTPASSAKPGRGLLRP